MFLHERHQKNYKVFNLSGRSYDYSKFNNEVIPFFFLETPIRWLKSPIGLTIMLLLFKFFSKFANKLTTTLKVKNLLFLLLFLLSKLGECCCYSLSGRKRTNRNYYRLLSAVLWQAFISWWCTLILRQKKVQSPPFLSLMLSDSNKITTEWLSLRKFATFTTSMRYWGNRRASWFGQERKQSKCFPWQECQSTAKMGVDHSWTFSWWMKPRTPKYT